MEKLPKDQPEQPQTTSAQPQVLTKQQAVAQYNDLKQKYSLFFQ